MVAAAIVGGAVVGAAGTAIAGSKSSSATKKASDAAVQQQQQALQQQATLSAPYRALGESAIPTLQSLLGIGAPASPSPGAGSGYRITPGGGVQPILQAGPGGATGGVDSRTATLRSTPGYQFALNEGLDATKNAASASGLLLSGNTLEGLDRYATGIADQTYGNEVARLMGVVDTGQAAAAGQAANVGAAANNISSNLINQGNTLAGINANTVAGITRAIGSGIDQYGAYQTLEGLNNPAVGIGGYSAASDAYIGNEIGYPSTIGP